MKNSPFSTACLVIARKGGSPVRGALAGSFLFLNMLNEEQIQFHIKNNEIFIQLATWIDLHSQEIGKKMGDQSRSYPPLDDVRDHLMYLHRTCRVIPKKK